MLRASMGGRSPRLKPTFLLPHYAGVKTPTSLRTGLFCSLALCGVEEAAEKAEFGRKAARAKRAGAKAHFVSTVYWPD